MNSLNQNIVPHKELDNGSIDNKVKWNFKEEEYVQFVL
jgi:hypothetical protein